MQGARAPRDQGQSSGRMSALGRSSVILLTYVLAATELTCLFMQFSVVPYLSRKLGLDSIAFGYLQTTFGVLQLLGGPVFGRFADQRGARAALTLSFLAALALYLLLAAASSPALPGVYLLFASRLPGALMHTLPAAQMVITDLSAPEERPAALGRLGLCFGVGVILGSLLGGTLVSAYGIQCPAILAALATLLGAVLSFTCIPASTKGAKTDAQAPLPGGPRASVFDLKAIASLLRLPDVPRIFLVKVASNFPTGDPGPGHRAAEQPLLGGGAAPGQRAGLHRGGPGHGLDVQRLPLLPPGARPGVQPLHPQRGHRQHADQGCLHLGHRDHAGPLRLCTTTAPNSGTHGRRPPVPQVWRPHLRPRAGCYQYPCPPGPLEETYAPEEGQSPVTAAQTQTGNKLLLNPSDPFRPGFCRLTHGLPASFSEGWGLGLEGFLEEGAYSWAKLWGGQNHPNWFTVISTALSPPMGEFPLLPHKQLLLTSQAMGSSLPNSRPQCACPRAETGCFKRSGNLAGRSGSRL
ncbi:solute carrier family 22 member 18 isoform X2 [Pan paniscus]|uniref:solute carrier family 22 member 18 isoform X2 n=1 Tax=Pan paniscus TaxID=9597 RepID=UPI0030056A76